MVKKTLYLLLFLFSLSSGQSTIKIEGIVLDSQTGMPLAGANVQVEGSAVGSASDNQGRFSVENLLVGSYTLRVRYIGYEQVRLTDIRVENDHRVWVPVYLDPQVLEMQELVVSAERSDPGEPANVVTIGVREIERSGAINVAEVLKDINGVDILQSGDSSSDVKVSIRGGRSNQVAVIVDGIRLDDQMAGQIDLSTIPLSTVQEIKVYKGAHSSIFGNGALSGAIHIITKNNMLERASASLTGGSFGLQQVNLILSPSFNRISLLLSLESTRANNNFPFRYEQGNDRLFTHRQNADTQKKQFFSKLVYKHDRHQALASASILRSQRGLPGQVHALTPYAKAAADRDLFSGRYDYQSQAFKFHSKISYLQQFSTYQNRYDRNQVPLEFRFVPPYENKDRLKQLTVHNSAIFKPMDNHEFRFSAEMGRSDYRYENVYAIKDNLQVTETGQSNGAGYYVVKKNNWLSLDRFDLQTGVRYDYSQTRHAALAVRQDTFWSPMLSVGFSKTALLPWQVHASWSRAFRLPTFADLFYQDFRVQGNADLLPEKSQSLDLALTVNWRGHRFRTLFFYNQIDDLIVWRMGSFATFRPFNTNALLQGSEIEWSRDYFRQSVQTHISYIYLDSRNLSGERTTHAKALPYRPEHTFKLALKINSGFLFGQYHGRLVSERFITEANTITTPGYTVHDVSAGCRFTLFALEHKFKASVYNIFDERYTIFESMPIPGRTFRVTWSTALN